MKRAYLWGIAGILILALCYRIYNIPKAENPFPLPKELIEKVLQEQQLPWTLGELSSFTEGQEIYPLLNERKKTTAHLFSYAADGRRGLALQFTYPQGASNITESILEEDWPRMLDLACALYGDSEASQKLFQQFRQDAQKQKWEKRVDGVIFWHKKQGGVHYVLMLAPKASGSEHLVLKSIELLNELHYQEYLKMREKVDAKIAERVESES